MRNLSVISDAGQRLSRACAAAAAFVALFGMAAPTLAQSPADTKFIAAAAEDAFGRVTFPAFRGTSGGSTVYYIITEASDLTTAQRLGVNFAPALANARDTSAVQRVSTNSGPFAFPATVDFSPARSASQPGSVGFPGYSPLIQLPNGIVINAPHVANGTGNHDRVIALDTVALRVILDESDGFQGNQPVRYLATDASDTGAAIAERATFAPSLQALPGPATANLALIGNGQTGLNNVQRQGVNSVVESAQADPLNILEFNPLQAGYSPMWEVEPHNWTASEVTLGRNVRQRDYAVVEALEAQGRLVTPPPPPIDVYVNCPIVAQRSAAIEPSVTPVLTSATIGFRPLGSLSGNVLARIVSVTVTDGNGFTANGVLAAVELRNGPSGPAIGSGTCVTSNGTCVVSFGNLQTISSHQLNLIRLNRIGHSPGVDPSLSR